ncbi:MAG: ThuA domain-containing protein [Clostridia bacterium]|nr:ThuA domain-containing protein [Clostridia bacterium]
MSKLNITVWNEFRHEKSEERIQKVYPKGIHEAIADALRKDEAFNVCTATLDEPEHGLTDEVLEKTDVLIWWGHIAHGDVKDEIVDKVYDRVLNGMGLIVLHSGHFSKIFKKLMGTSARLKWREVGEKERLWVIERGHPIAGGLGEYIELPNEEMYGERFDIPAPDELVFISWFEGGEVFRSGCCYNRGKGKVFYFRPGHESFPIYYNEDILKVISNACKWASPPLESPPDNYANASAPLEVIKSK